eukprot:gene24858-10518_t
MLNAMMKCKLLDRLAECVDIKTKPTTEPKPKSFDEVDVPDDRDSVDTVEASLKSTGNPQ